MLITADFYRLCEETREIADDDDRSLNIGYLRNYGGAEFLQAVAGFTEKISRCSPEYPGLEEMLKKQF